MTELRLLGVVGGPEPGGRTSTAVAAVLAGAADAGATTSLLELSGAAVPEVVSALATVDGVVLGSPVYRATYSALLKELLERTERGKWGEATAPRWPTSPGRCAPRPGCGRSAPRSDFFISC